jgi:hypothetical protein
VGKSQHHLNNVVSDVTASLLLVMLRRKFHQLYLYLLWTSSNIYSASSLYSKMSSFKNFEVDVLKMRNFTNYLFIYLP